MNTIINTIFALFVVQRVGFAELFRLPLANGLVIALAFLLIHVIFRDFFGRRRIQRGAFDGRILLRELFSSSTLVLGGVIAMFTIYLVQRGIAVVEYGETTLLAVLGQAVLYFLLFDLYFYTVHRVLHVGVVYDWVHTVHHRSTMPNPLTTFSIHPIEALLTGGFLPLALTLFPFHLYTVTRASRLFCAPKRTRCQRNRCKERGARIFSIDSAREAEALWLGRTTDPVGRGYPTPPPGRAARQPRRTL